jgi:malic enzyme
MLNAFRLNRLQRSLRARALTTFDNKGKSIKELEEMPDSYVPPLLSRNESSSRHRRVLKTPQFGKDILHDPLWNKGTAFSIVERDMLGIRGLLPPTVRTIEEQLERVKVHLNNEESDEKKNLYLQDLANRNETLYFRTLVDDIATMAPLVYTPTVGLVCQQFGNQFRRCRGMYLGTEDRSYMSSIIHNWDIDDVHIIVVTDGSRILGLGDLGINGMGIPIGKLALYCAAGGIAPHRVLPVTLDVGTNNPELLKDCNYMGEKHSRLVGPDYFDMVDEFMHAVYARWPDVIVQFEDFETSKAVPLLARYRDRYRMFNDDIQGTGSVTLACLLSATNNAGIGSLKDIRILCAGAGSAGLGVCSQILDGMVEDGLDREEALKRFVVMTMHGALGQADGKNDDPNHKEGITEDQIQWVSSLSDGSSLLDAIKEHKPNVILGLSTAKGIFNKEVLEEMAKINAKPIIMPMSNPTSRAECTAEEAYKYTNGAAIVATGSPFEPVVYNNKTYIPSQCNNMYIFPGIGLACSVSGLMRITDRMLYVAAEACAHSMTPEEIAEGRTFPNIKRIRDVSRIVAVAVIKEGLRHDMCPKLKGKKMKVTDDDIYDKLSSYVESKMYYPIYVPLVHERRK